MVDEEINKIDKFLSDKYQLRKYQDLKKLKGVEFNERMKLEFALRDLKNIEAIEYLTIVYKKKKKNNELISKQSFEELLNEAENINFFSLNVLNIEVYKHELISPDLFEIFQYLIQRNILNRQNDDNNNDNYNIKLANEIIKKIDHNITEISKGDYKYVIYVNMDIDEFEIKKKYSYDYSFHIEDDDFKPEYLEKDSEHFFEKNYDETNIKVKSNNIFVNNINLQINLAMPEEELIDNIKKLSKLYKSGKIIKKVIQEETFESVFSVIGTKYLTNTEEFLKILFIYDIHHDKDINNNRDKLFKAISKKFKSSVNIIENSSEKSELSIKTIKDLSGKFKKTLENQLYLQL